MQYKFFFLVVIVKHYSGLTINLYFQICTTVCINNQVVYFANAINWIERRWILVPLGKSELIYIIFYKIVFHYTQCTHPYISWELWEDLCTKFWGSKILIQIFAHLWNSVLLFQTWNLRWDFNIFYPIGQRIRAKFYL